jgi:hypothetical protein
VNCDLIAEEALYEGFMFIRENCETGPGYMKTQEKKGKKQSVVVPMSDVCRTDLIIICLPLMSPDVVCQRTSRNGDMKKNGMRKSLLNHHVVLCLKNESEGLAHVLVIFEVYQYPGCVYRRSLS